jgi:hypothetical protein
MVPPLGGFTWNVPNLIIFLKTIKNFLKKIPQKALLSQKLKI